MGAFRWRYGWGWGYGYSPLWWLFGGYGGGGYYEDDYAVTDDWVPWGQRWKDEDKDGKPILPPPAYPPPLPVERGFRDEQLEALINEGKLREARKYLRDMVAIAREMNDKQTEANYEQYEQEIELASMESHRLAHREKENGENSDSDGLIHL